MGFSRALRIAFPVLVLLAYGWAGFLAVLVVLDITISKILTGGSGLVESALRLGVAIAAVMVWLYTWRMLTLWYRSRLLGGR